MNIVQSIVLGVVEGLTEFLPVSSTAHMLIFERLLNLESSEFLKTFTISIQLGAILAVMVLYWRDLRTNKHLWKQLIIAFLPTAVLGLLFYKIIKTYLLDNLILIAWALLLGGLLITIFELKTKKIKSIETIELKSISYKKAALIGLAQSVAFIPGVSRSAATILGGLSLKINRPTIVTFSFLLAIPTMLAATGLDLAKNASSFNGAQIEFWLIGLVVSFFTALVVIKGFIKFITNHNFMIFGIYRIILGLIILAVL